MAISITGTVHKDRNTTEGTTLIDGDTASGQQPVGQSGFSLLMSEEFNGSSVTVDDAGLGYVHFRPGGMQWATWYPNWPRFTSQSPGGNHTNTSTDTYYATDKVSLDGAGNAVLTLAHTSTVGGLAYTGGMIQCLNSCSFQYGYVETRLRAPTLTSSNKQWPAAWLHCAVTDQWPPEIDYFESIVSDTTYGNNVYLPSGTSDQSNITGAPAASAFHVYAVWWTSSFVKFYRDGVLTHTSTASAAPSTNMFLLFDMASSSGASAAGTLEIDYVRVWQ